MINYLYILASLSLFHTALGAVAAAPGPQNGTDTTAIHLVNRNVFGERVVSLNVTNKEQFAIQLPESDDTDIDTSKTFGHSPRVWYSHGNTTNGQETLAQDFFSTSATSKEGGKNGAGFVQLAGCINLGKAPQLNPSDKGGFYHDTPGDQAEDLQRSRCEGYTHFVECVQPRNRQFILRCCNDKEDCPTPSGSQKCSDVLSGSYGTCSEART
ncbi:hypothetical protein PLEOSDRAFT_1072386 [Pleurotus ostreatus PC15]|uniref:Uncharacterized protein n=1 Tax=Pleurotus ostreatus (strain PC15) TaxID=1137138 RepID=A0A067NMQ5_PLEO1|nr:hypothetical protein PLEOSDRAFT_1072386 [Pleurotus ostreatus PC15]